MASLEYQTAYPNTTTSVAINVNSLININSFTFYIQYNPEVLEFIGLSDAFPGMTGMIANPNGSVISIIWSSPSIAYSPAGTLCKMNFLFKGTTGTLTFLPGCEVTHGAIPFLVGYTNGSVSSECTPTDAKAIIGDIAGATGDLLNLPVNFSNFPDVGAFTQYIHYDVSKLTFISITTGGSLVGTIYSANNGVITVSWVTPLAFPGGKNINTITPNMMKLNFECNFPGNSTVEFGPGGVFTTGNPSLNNIEVCYTNGNVTQTPTVESASLPNQTGIVQGEDIFIPLNLNISVPVSSFTLYLNFNSPVLSFTGIQIVNPLSASVIPNVSGSLITLVYTDPTSGLILPGTFLNLKFKYNGIIPGFVNFIGMSQFTNNFYQPINVGFSNSTISPGVDLPNATVTIGTVTGNVNDFVEIPIDIINGYPNPLLGAATMFIGFDESKLSFIGAVNNIHNATVNLTGNQIGIAWVDPSGVNLTGVFLKLKFQYHGGGGNSCSSEVYFKNDNLTIQPCELANNLAEFVPGNWVKGGVNLSLAQPVINGPPAPPANSTAYYSTDIGMINYNWIVSGGIIVTGNGSNSITVDWGAVGPGSISVDYNNAGGCYLTYTKTIMKLSGSPITNIEGYVTYDNLASQGLNGVNITLFNSLGVQVGIPVSTYTNVGNGFYSFIGVPQDAYTIVVNPSAPWAGTPGVSALDALIDELQTVGLFNPPLSGIRLAAANVDGGSSVNSTDALNIKKRIIGEISSFPVGDWVFNNGIINAFNSPVSNYNFKGLCTGDVNGSYNLIANKSATVFDIVEDDIQTITTNEWFTYNIKSAVNSQLGAMTLFLAYDYTRFEIEKVNTNMVGLKSSIKNGNVAVAWSNPSAGLIGVGDVILSFRIKARQPITNPGCIFTIMAESELADPLANIINTFKFQMAKVISNTNQFSFTTSPNPFRNSTNILFYLPDGGKAKFSITNLVGRQICVLFDEIVSSGNHVVLFDANKFNLTPGIYLGKLEFESLNEKISTVNKLILTK